MPFISLPERMAIEKGLFLAIEDALREKFGEEGAKLMPEIIALDDREKYRAMNRAIVKAGTLDDMRRAIAAAAAPPPKKSRGKKPKS